MNRTGETPTLKVFVTTRESHCDECGENLGRGAWITLIKDKGALYLTCADLDHLFSSVPVMRLLPGVRVSIRLWPPSF